MQQEATLNGPGSPPKMAPVAEAARAGPGDALGPAGLYPRYREEVFRYVSRRIARHEEAEDIVAEVFVAAAQAWLRFRGRYEVRLWLLGIARRKVIDSRRRARRRRETLASEIEGDRESSAFTGATSESAGPEAAALRAESGRAMRALVETLKEEQREALLLQYVEELTIAEIAVVMRRSPAAVNSLLQRARAALQRRGHAYFSEMEGTNDRTK